MVILLLRLLINPLLLAYCKNAIFVVLLSVKGCSYGGIVERKLNITERRIYNVEKTHPNPSLGTGEKSPQLPISAYSVYLCLPPFLMGAFLA